MRLWSTYSPPRLPDLPERYTFSLRLLRCAIMERVIQLHIEKLPEGVYLGTSEDVQGLVAQGRTIQETIEIARDVAKKLLESQSGVPGSELPVVSESFDFPLIVAT